MRRGSEREHGEERVDPTVKEGRFQGGKGGQARRASLGGSRRKHERVQKRRVIVLSETGPPAKEFAHPSLEVS